MRPVHTRKEKTRKPGLSNSGPAGRFLAVKGGCRLQRSLEGLCRTAAPGTGTAGEGDTCSRPLQ